MQTAQTSNAAKNPSKSTSKSMRDAIDLLKADHADLKKMYRQYKKLVDQKADAEVRGDLAAQICHALTLHATVEEEIFYPAARAAIDDENVMDHADVEHASAKDLIAQIEAIQADDSHYDAKVCVLCEYVEHHAKEEEEEMFPKVRRKLDLKELGQQISARKAELERHFSSAE